MSRGRSQAGPSNLHLRPCTLRSNSSASLYSPQDESFCAKWCAHCNVSRCSSPYTIHFPHLNVPLQVHLQRQLIRPFTTAAICHIYHHKKALAAPPRLVAHPRPPCICEPRFHRPCEVVRARLARQPRRAASVHRVEVRFPDETLEVRKTTVVSTSAATLDRRYG